MSVEFLSAAGLTPAGRAEAIARADALLTWRTGIDAAMLNQAGRCLMALHYGPGTGPDVARIDLDEARRLGIYVASIPDYATGDWADQTMSLIADLSEKVKGSQGAKLKGRRLGIVGLGQVGRAVARRARAMGMTIWAHDPFASEEAFAVECATATPLAELAGIAQILSLHAPLGPATRGMIGHDFMGLIQPGSLLVNTASPELIDLDALAASMQRGRPAGAAFDADLRQVVDGTHPLLAQKSVLHGGCRCGASAGCAEACRARAARLVVDLFHGVRPPHLLIDPVWPRVDRLAAK